MKKIVFCFLLLLCGQHLLAQVPLDSAGRNPQYVATIIARSEKIVKALDLSDQTKAGNVRNIIVNRYFKLNDIYARHKDKDSLYADLYQHHFEFAADLANYLDDKEIEAVKDGMTFGVVPKTYQAHLEMIPTLKESEKLQILNWLKEAREFAIDADSAKAKHAWFGKYKGRINNWLARRGYDLNAEREAWYKRINEQKTNK